MRGPADLVVCNILRTMNVALIHAVRAALRPGGLAIFTGMEEPERPAFLAPLAASGFGIEDDATDAGWWAVAARRP